MSNQRKLDENRSNRELAPRRGAAREGQAFLQGLALCGRCGKHMAVHYKKSDKVMYRCMSRDTKKATCFEVCGNPIDKAVSKLFLEAVKPPEIELGMAVALEVERQAEEVAHQWRLRMERARFEAQLVLTPELGSS